MFRSLALASALLCALTVNAEARQRHKAGGLHPECGITMPCVAPFASTPEQARVARGRFVARQVGFGTAIEKRPVRLAKARAAKVDYRHVVRPAKRSIRVEPETKVTANKVPAPSVDNSSGKVSAQIVSHPEGCPRSLFCGCGAAVRVFGRPIRELWLAANWLRFPRAAPAPGMVAARRGHVFVLEAPLGGNKWQVYDANSGGRKTRIHARSLAGYTVVNPHGSKHASVT